MKTRRVAITLGGVLAVLILALTLWSLFRPAGPSRESVRRYFDSVPANLGWRIHSHSNWEEGWREAYNEIPMNERIWCYAKCIFSGFPEDIDSYSFKTPKDYVDTSVSFNGNSVEQIKIYGGWIPNPDTYVLQEDLRRRFPNLKVHVLPWSK